MKKLVGLVVLALFLPTFASANLLSNGGFETGDLSGWDTWNEGNTQSYDWGHNGSSHAVGGWWAFSGWQHIDGINPDATYTVGGYLYDDVAGGESMRNGVYANLEAQFKKADDSIVGTWSSGNITGADMVDDAWNEFIAQIKPSDYGTGITRVTFKWEMNNNGSGDGRGVFDDLTVEAVPEPGSIVLLGIGLAGIISFYAGKREK
ncbi:PEP-CTERM sorting domain-containing protein [bacterium]|jgi:hypothetical protein|nr:PEP-CTERM sorting domain-containing protein [bacterium]